MKQALSICLLLASLATAAPSDYFAIRVTDADTGRGVPIVELTSTYGTRYYTDSAGYCLVASAARDMPNGKRRLLSVVLGTNSREARASESQKLLNWGWQAWDAVRLFEAGKSIATVPVWKGEHREAKLGAPGALFVSVPKGEGDKLKTTVERTDPLIAPLTAGQRVGTIKVATAAGTTVASVPLVVMEPVGLAGIFGRAWDAIRLWVK